LADQRFFIARMLGPVRTDTFDYEKVNLASDTHIIHIYVETVFRALTAYKRCSTLQRFPLFLYFSRHTQHLETQLITFIFIHHYHIAADYSSSSSSQLPKDFGISTMNIFLQLVVVFTMVVLSESIDLTLDGITCDGGLPIYALDGDISMSCNGKTRCTFGDQVIISGSCKFHQISEKDISMSNRNLTFFGR
jgi:hypothetical protein